MKCILLSIRPQWVTKILNGKKTIEVRRGTTLYNAINKLIKEQGKAPCLIYCTKENRYDELLVYNKDQKIAVLNESRAFYLDDIERFPHLQKLNGKVVAEFEASAEIISLEEQGDDDFGCNPWFWETDTLTENELLERSCLTEMELEDYLQGWFKGKNGTAIHIHNLKVFDKPKELKEFYHSFCCKKHERKFANNNLEVDSKYKALRQPIRGGYEYSYPLTKAPQSWQYIESEENI